MRTSLATLVILSMALSACGWRDSRVNPMNWFGNSRSEPVTTQATGEANPLLPERESIFSRKPEEYPGTAVAQVTALSVEPSGGGAIIKVTGLTTRQGAFDVRLTSETEGEPVDGVLELDLRAIQPDDLPQGPEATRRVTAGRFVSDQTLARIREIRVAGARNVQTVRR